MGVVSFGEQGLGVVQKGSKGLGLRTGDFNPPTLSPLGVVQGEGVLLSPGPWWWG